jgi:hypothetical protein
MRGLIPFGIMKASRLQVASFLAGKPALANAMSCMKNCDLQISSLLCCAQDPVFFAFHVLNRTYCPVDT